MVGLLYHIWKGCTLMIQIMKKIVVIMLVALSVILVSCGSYSEKKYDEYCYKINQKVKELDFFIGKIIEKEIRLYDSDNNFISKLSFEEDYDESIKIKYFRKEGNKIFFIINVDVDDEEGLLFVNDKENSFMDGLKKVERISGNSYFYSTKE